MYILDIDRAESSLIKTLTPHPRGLWGLKYRNLIHQNGIAHTFEGRDPSRKDFADLKIHEVDASVKSLVELYAGLGPYAPKFLSVSGDLTQQALETALAARGRMEIVMILLRSDQGDKECIAEYSVRAADLLYHRTRKALAAGITHVTCPAWLLPVLHQPHKFSVRIATGTRSDTVPAHEHVQPRTFAQAFAAGATHAIVGREVTHSSDPLRTLKELLKQIPPPS